MKKDKIPDCMVIGADTKIATLLKIHPKALDAIISISPKLEKLRNPVLRKLIAGRTTISMASKIGDCSVIDFFKILQPLGFEPKDMPQPAATPKTRSGSFLTTVRPDSIITIDVRPVISSGNDPLAMIMERVRALQKGQVLKVVNSFEPIPLIALLEKKGMEVYVNEIGPENIETYCKKTSDDGFESTASEHHAEWKDVLEKFEGRLETLNVRHLKMPKPMITIIQHLINFPSYKALYVIHKRVPVFLLPKLAELGYDCLTKEISQNEVHLIIYKK